MKCIVYRKAIPACLLVLFMGCQSPPNHDMIRLLAQVDRAAFSGRNPFYPEARLLYYDSLLKETTNLADSLSLGCAIARTYLELGKEEKALLLSEALLHRIPPYEFAHRQAVLKSLAIACLRMGERTNCVKGHTGESCIFPIRGGGVHADKAGSRRAIAAYEQVLAADPSDLESKWLLNIAYMTIGGYPGSVPPALLLPGLERDTADGIKPFTDAALFTGLNTHDMAGGALVEDFNNDGYLDVVSSSWGLQQHMHYHRNNGDGSFTDLTRSSTLGALTGGLNLLQTDYNNDGLKDIFVLRGAWKGKFGKEPNSLLKNNGDGTFTDVTKAAGLLSFHPTQTATWNDFNNDGWLDVFIGNESATANDRNPCELFMNNGDGTFTEMAVRSGCAIVAFVKGVTSGDYDRDGRADIFVSTLDGRKYLLKNTTSSNGPPQFTDVTAQAGLSQQKTRTFPTWFWDYDNDGWPDILVAGYEFDNSLAWYAAIEALGKDAGNSGKLFLFHNNRDGTFEEVSKKAGLNKQVFAMGANFGDLDNDGYADMYFGTGNPLYQSLVPNKLFRNQEGKTFQDITTSARVGNLQKGHGVSFADLDNDGDQDIYIDMGGAYTGDGYQSSLYLNPGQNGNRWIDVDLEGSTSNRAAIGASIKITFREKGKGLRSVYRDVNSGGSFGANPLLQHIGIGQADIVDSLEITWPVSRTVQKFANIPAGMHLTVREGAGNWTPRKLNRLSFTAADKRIIGCTPDIVH